VLRLRRFVVLTIAALHHLRVLTILPDPLPAFHIRRPMWFTTIDGQCVASFRNKNLLCRHPFSTSGVAMKHELNVSTDSRTESLRAMQLYCLRILLFLGAWSLVSWANADVITTPTDLNPGDQYRLVFVTSGVINATSSDIATYNTFVNNAAAASPLSSLGATWFALGSTATVNARNNTQMTVSDVDTPIYLINDTRVANNVTQFWNTTPLLAAPNRTELDTVPSLLSGTGQARIWTGTRHPGTNTSNRLGEGVVINGDANFLDVWIARLDNTNPSAQYHMLAVSEVLTVGSAAVPEPSSFALLSLGVFSVIRCQRRKQKRVS
jgi:hypothetical protein